MKDKSFRYTTNKEVEENVKTLSIKLGFNSKTAFFKSLVKAEKMKLKDNFVKSKAFMTNQSNVKQMLELGLKVKGYKKGDGIDYKTLFIKELDEIMFEYSNVTFKNKNFCHISEVAIDKILQKYDMILNQDSYEEVDLENHEIKDIIRSICLNESKYDRYGKFKINKEEQDIELLVGELKTKLYNSITDVENEREMLVNLINQIEKKRNSFRNKGHCFRSLENIIKESKQELKRVVDTTLSNREVLFLLIENIIIYENILSPEKLILKNKVDSKLQEFNESLKQLRIYAKSKNANDKDYLQSILNLEKGYRELIIYIYEEMKLFV
ncbi:conserved hypothetical protein [Vibrio aestuarianus]|uniref:hypothetical protein n=1 Tax=Vibrio aestuarianus TaxID=28171 RepID=UPI001455E258|nr:hypothetical protein [Vibrio aestuarianus]NLS56569.1 hypothetical protein [Vibrio aestuarianus subsp. francensis]CAH8232108.1 conserved hypothetical protein [Vibrio aestuarianus]